MLCSMIGGYRLYSCAVWLVCTDCTAVQYDWLVPTVQLCCMIGGYRLYRCAVWLVGTECTAVRYDWWVPTVQLSVCSSEVCFRPEDGSSTSLRNTDTNTVVLPSFSLWVRRSVTSFCSVKLKVLIAGKLCALSLQGLRSTAAGWKQNLVLWFIVCL